MARRKDTFNELISPGIVEARVKQVSDILQNAKTFVSGARRNDAQRAVRFDLICPSAIERYAKVCQEGSLKYGERNWEKGIPFSNYIDHAINHLMHVLKGSKGEDHLGHALWNIAAAIHNEEACVHGIATRKD